MKKAILALAIVLFASVSYAQDSLAVNKLGQFQFGVTMNEVWGYHTATDEYALCGLNTGFSIVDVTNPSVPIQKHFIPGEHTIWRDIKTWSHYAYVVHDGVGSSGNSEGIRIIDLNTIDSASLSFVQFYPTVTIDTVQYTFQDAHNLYVDENGVLYVFGSNLGNGGASMFDLKQNPMNPTYLGTYNDSYYHDGIAVGDTLYGAAINKGRFEVVDVSNKVKPVMWASQVTPNNFCHNIWFSDDHKKVFTTDEKTGAFVTAYDVSDLNNITELDRIRTGIYDPNLVIPHNTHVLNDFLVTSYYTSGLQIVDASEPDILIETAYYDTSPFSGDGFQGAWGAYPYLPSGNILVSDRQEGLFILGSTYPRACFFRAFVKDSVTKLPIPDADITMVRTQIFGKTDLHGNFKSGRRDTGDFLVVVEKPGYHTDTLHVKMRRGVMQSRSVALIPIGFSIDENGYLTKSLQVYPNPSRGDITLELNGIHNGLAEIKVFDLSGRQHYESHVESSAERVNLSLGLKQGVYIINLTIDGNTYATQRLVILP